MKGMIFMLLVSAFATSILGTINKCPWWVPVILLIIAAFLMNGYPVR